MGIIQPMAEFPSETMKVRLTNKFKVLKEKKSCQIRILYSEKILPKNKSKTSTFRSKKSKKFGHKQLCNCSFGAEDKRYQIETWILRKE